MNLTPQQLKAINHVRQLASLQSQNARAELEAIFDHASLKISLLDTLFNLLRTNGRVAIHFHPDRLFSEDQTVAMGLLAVGVYRNQYETGISGGSPTAFLGGERHGWEEDLFGGAYSYGEGDAASRPKYGALQILRYPDGPSPRFGSSYFVLSAEATSRSTFTFQGSQEDVALRQSGSLETMAPVLAALFRTGEEKGAVLDRRYLSIAGLADDMMKELPRPFFDPSHGELGRALDSFVEAQVHGPVRLTEDIERLVADSVYRETETGDLLHKISRRYEIKLDWHPGYMLPVKDVPDYFRGYATKPLAMRIAGEGTIDASNIGAAANSYYLKPELWRELGTLEEGLTHFRRIWHVLVKKALPLTTQEHAGS